MSGIGTSVNYLFVESNQDLEAVTENGNITPKRIILSDGSVDLTTLDTTSLPTILSTRPNIILANTLSDDSVVSNHGFSDNNVIEKPVNAWSYNTFDAFPHLKGSSDYDHYAGFQARLWYEGTGTISDIRGYSSAFKISSGNVTRLHNFRIYDATGAGIITENVGLYINSLIKGVTNWAIYTAGNTQSLFEGNINLAGKNGLPNTAQNILRFTSGSGNLPISSIHHQFASTSEGSLHFKVRNSSTSGDAGLAEILKLNGGANPTLIVTGKGIFSDTVKGIAAVEPEDFVIKSQLPSIITASATLDFPSTAVGAKSDLLLNVPGAEMSDTVVLGIPHPSIQNAGVFVAWVDKPDSVTIRFMHNDPVNPVDPPSGLFKIKIIKD